MFLLLFIAHKLDHEGIHFLSESLNQIKDNKQEDCLNCILKFLEDDLILLLVLYQYFCAKTKKGAKYDKNCSVYTIELWRRSLFLF